MSELRYVDMLMELEQLGVSRESLDEMATAMMTELREREQALIVLRMLIPIVMSSKWTFKHDDPQEMWLLSQLKALLASPENLRKGIEAMSTPTLSRFVTLLHEKILRVHNVQNTQKTPDDPKADSKASS